MRTILLAFVLGAAVQADAAVCLRFAGAPAAVTAGDGCEDALTDFARAGRASALMRDYDDFLLAQERHPRRAWRDFLQRALKKVWSEEDERLMREVVAWARAQGWKLDPALREQTELLVQGQELELRPRAGHDGWLEALAREPGYEDVRVLAPALAHETEGALLASRLPRRWVVFSSVFRPRAFWARAADLPGLLKTTGAAWVEGDCLNPRFNGLHSERFEIRAYGANGCSTANLARVATGLAAEPFMAGPTGTSAAPGPELRRASKVNWIVMGLLAGAAAAAYSMRDKTVVITHGFGR